MAHEALLITPSPGLVFIKPQTTGCNGDSVIDPNECNDLFLILKNPGITNSPSWQGVLTTTSPGVIIGGPTLALPSVPAGGFFTNLQPFKIGTTPDFICGVPIQLRFVMTFTISNRTVITTNDFQLATGLIQAPPILVNNSISTGIPDGNTNGIDSVINISGVSVAIGKVTVLCYVTHPQVGDLVLQLIGPDGTNVTLVANRGFLGANFGTNCPTPSSRTTFDDNAPSAVAFAAAPFVGSFRPEQPLTAFSGKTGSAVNGAWRLRAIDSVTGNSGNIECWTLALYPSICTDGGGFCAPDLMISSSATPNPGLLGSDLAFNVTVTNRTPVGAPGVILSNVLPAGVTFVSATSSQGACTFANNTVRCNVGTIGGNAGVGVAVIVRPTVAATLTKHYSVTGTLRDVNPADNTLDLVTSVVAPTPLMVTAGAALVSESFAPSTGGIEAGETVAVDLTLRNDGTAPVTNLVAALQSGNGVSAPGAPQTYGAIAPGASATQRFTFTADGAAGSSILAVLQLQDGLQSLGTVGFNFGVGASGTFASSAPIVINEFGSATPYPAVINVSGLQGVISKVTVTLSKLTHSWPDDIDALLVGPHGQALMLMSDTGGGNAITNKTLVFDASASAHLPDATLISSGIYLPTDFEAGDVMFAPAPAGPYGSVFGAFTGTDPNGPWSLYIMDDSASDSGIVNGGWTLDISTTVPVNPLANIAVNLSYPAQPVVGEPRSYVITIANLGPSTATNIFFSNSLVNVSYAITSIVASAGSAGFSGDFLSITGTIPTLVSGASETVTVGFHANSPTVATNLVTAASPLTDPDLSNNSMQVTLATAASQTDVALAVTAAPVPVFVGSNLIFTVTVTNRGPSHAWAVEVADVLPAGWAFLGSVTSRGSVSNNGSAITCRFNDLAQGESATASLLVAAGPVGVVTNRFVATSSIPDPDASNNSVVVTTVVNAATPLIVAGAAALVGEAAPADGGISPGETVTVNFALRNVGTADTTDLIATLQNSGGVTPVTSSVNYGAAAANGGLVTRSFALSAAAAAAGSITATLHLQDGAQDLGSVTFTLPVVRAQTVGNATAITIADIGKAGTYPSMIDIEGITGAVTKVTVTLNGFTHTYPSDLDVLLVGPGGQKIMLMSGAGNSFAVSGVNLTFDDAASAPIPQSSQLASTSYRCATYHLAPSLPSPAPAGPYATALAAFNGTNPNGVWSLYVNDTQAGDGGQIAGGWAVNVQTSTPIGSGNDVSVAIAAPAFADFGSALSYTITAANNGPGTATGVVLTDVLPAGFALSSATISQGSVVNNGGVLTASIGALGSGSSATLNVNGTVTGFASLTNTASVTAAQADLIAANNTAVKITGAGLKLQVRRSGANVIVGWPASAAGYILESSGSAFGPWTSSSAILSVNGSQNEVSVPASGSTFYRLRKP